MNLKACRRLFDSTLMKRTRKPLVVGRLTPFSSLMRFDKIGFSGKKIHLFFLFILWFLCWSPKCALSLAAVLKFDRFEWTRWKFSHARVYKTIWIRLLLKACGVFFLFSMVAVSIDIWSISEKHKRDFLNCVSGCCMCGTRSGCIWKNCGPTLWHCERTRPWSVSVSAPKTWDEVMGEK